MYPQNITVRLKFSVHDICKLSHPIPKFHFFNGMGPRLGNGISPCFFAFLRGGIWQAIPKSFLFFWENFLLLVITRVKVVHTSSDCSANPDSQSDAYLAQLVIQPVEEGRKTKWKNFSLRCSASTIFRLHACGTDADCTCIRVNYGQLALSLRCARCRNIHWLATIY